MRKKILLLLTSLGIGLSVSINAQQVGKITWYGKAYHGNKTASGERFDMNGLTTASNTHKFGTKLKVTNPSNGKSVIVRVTDRGAFTKYGVLLDLSYAAFKTIADPKQGVIKNAIVEKIN